MASHQTAGQAALERCRKALARIEAGLKLLPEDENAAEAFRFANLAMWQQRIHTIISLKKRRDEPVDERAIDVPANRSWYPFQLAFILLNLPGITKLDHQRPHGRGRGRRRPALVPHRRRQDRGLPGPVGLHAGPAAACKGRSPGVPGEHGVAVLMRYTLRLLTIQQFQRATALICACEVIRRGDEKKWGKEPFRIGLWVGQKTTPNTTDQAAEAIQQEHGGKFKGRGQRLAGPVDQLPLVRVEDRPRPATSRSRATPRAGAARLTYCGDVLGRCPFSAKQSPLEGVPVLVVDEEIYRRLPTLLIATVDKFAQMPWNGKVQMLFGQVEWLLRPARVPFARDRGRRLAPEEGQVCRRPRRRTTRCCAHPT